MSSKAKKPQLPASFSKRRHTPSWEPKASNAKRVGSVQRATRRHQGR